ncbi:DegV family protein [Fusibacter bizertensis]
MKITLITDSTCDLQPELLSSLGVQFAPLKVLFKDKEYIDKIDLTNSEFYNLMRQSRELPTTSQVNPGEFYELFSQELSKGNQVIGIFLSSELSGTYGSAVVAKEMLGNEGIHLIDSRTVSFALGLIVLKLQEKINSGASIDEVLAMGNTLVARSQLYGMLDSLENLKKGGRLSSGTAMIGKMLNLKPIIEVQNGLVKVAEKARGSRKGLAWMVEQLSSHYPNGKIESIAIAHANNAEKLADIKQLLLERFDIGKIYEVEIGSVVGTHAGEGAVGITFYKTLD